MRGTADQRVGGAEDVPGVRDGVSGGHGALAFLVADGQPGDRALQCQQREEERDRDDAVADHAGQVPAGALNVQPQRGDGERVRREPQPARRPVPPLQQHPQQEQEREADLSGDGNGPRPTAERCREQVGHGHVHDREEHGGECGGQDRDERSEHALAARQS